MNNLKSMLDYSLRVLLILVLSTFATEVASAKTITQSTNVIDTSTLDYFDNVYKRENYKNYLLVNEYVGTGYNYVTYYYMCLTNDKIDTSNTLNVSTTCDKMYRYYRNGSTYSLEEVNDTSLTAINSVYYSYEGKKFVIEKLLILLNVGLFCVFLSYCLLKILGG